MENLNIKRYDDYNYWIILCMIFVNEKLNLNILDKYSKQSKKYDKSQNQSIIEKIKRTNRI